MAPSLEISIPSTSTASPPDAKQHTLYAISLRQPLRSYTVQKRYSDFVNLHSALTSQTSQEPPAPLPKKSWFKSTISSPELTESRRQALETYLRAINDSPDPRWRHCHAWLHFLNLPSNLAATTEGQPRSSALGARYADLQAAGMDPSIWLDVHRDLKSQLSEARGALRRYDTATTAQTQQDASAELKRYVARSGTVVSREAVRRRDSATTAQAQHDAAADVKRHLTRSDTLLSSLDEALRNTSATGKGEKATMAKGAQLGEGEIRRRRDLLSAARKERDALERQLLAVQKGSPMTGPATQADEDSPFRPQMRAVQSSSTNTTTSRRVLGPPAAKETERTRPLDNEGLLALQQQVMQEQDADVTDLTAVVKRMKEMGYQINDELQLQNEMLGLLGNDVDRVEDKLGIAKKRIGKIN